MAATESFLHTCTRSAVAAHVSLNFECESVIGTATVIVLGVSKKKKAFPWGTAAQCHVLQADNLGCCTFVKGGKLLYFDHL